jgi:tetratricopeptide (TPR) repeat protein
MKQKIEWYREVLELEPGSKVFFPLARLLAADGRTEEAVTVLRQGLLRHPDHVETRLLLVELLYRQCADADLSAELNDLAHLFAAYPGFWSAWSASIAADPVMGDASLAMRFFAAALQGRQVGWVEIMEQGLQAALRADAGPVGTATRTEAIGTEPAPSSAQPDNESGIGNRSVASAQASAASATPDNEAGIGSRSVSGSPPCGPDVHTPFPPLSTREREEDAGTDDYEEADEGISLRTRSMAEVLAEQGDFPGALDIYRELQQSALPGDRPSLEARIGELSRRMADVSDHPAGREEKGPAPIEESSKIVNLFESLSFVESLAERLEARAR